MRLAGAVALTGTLVLIAAAPALGAITITGARVEAAQHKIKQFDRPTVGNAGGKLRCPKSKRILTGGAFWHQTGTGPDPAISNLVQLTSSAPLGGRTWYADGRNNAANPRTLTLEVRCLPKGQLDKAVTVSNSKKIKTGFAGKVKVTCPRGTEPITGGTYFSEPGEPPKPGVGAERGRITGSYPQFDEWHAIGGNFSEGKLALTAVARCYPENRFDGSAGFGHPTIAAASTGGGYLPCGAGRRALTGGVSWSRTTENFPDPELATSTYLSGNAPTFDVLGIYTAGLNADSTNAHDLDTIVICPAL